MNHAQSNPDEFWLVVVTYNRPQYLSRCLDAIEKHEPNLKIMVIDNGDDEQTQALLLKKFAAGNIHRILLNQNQATPQWQKGFALSQAIELLKMEKCRELAWVDDDVILHKPFSALAQRVFKKDVAALVNFLVDPTQDDIHPVIERVSLDGDEVSIKATFNGAAVAVPFSIFECIGLPPSREGVNVFSVEDWYYSRIIEAQHKKVACFDAALHEAYDDSQRERL